MKKVVGLSLAATLVITSPSTAGAGVISVSVQDYSGSPVRDAVIYATPALGKPPALKTRGVVEQRNKQFIPYVSVVQAGTAVQFPNEDSVKHHVYSFSPAKKFELPLYSGTPAEPVVFDKPGVVTLGCNIHDWMIAYILVVQTPWFSVTNSNGEAQLRDLPAGTYDVEVWQPRLKNPLPRPREHVVVASEKPPGNISFQVDLKPEFHLRRSPTDIEASYR